MLFSRLLLLVIIRHINCYSVFSKLPEVFGENERSHLKYKHVIEICNNRSACKSNDSSICAVREFNGSFQYENYENSCYLFLSNMCDHPGVEYHIVEGGTCEAFLRSNDRIQRRVEDFNVTSTISSKIDNNVSSSTGILATLAPVDLRSGAVSRLYDIDTAFDYHHCPLSCPNTYSPVCVSANRGAGKYFKFFTFINHCKGDVYYCKHFEEFGPPPDADEENVNSSPLSWSYCGAYRYMQFARFSEVLSSMSHYGWLVGDQRYSQIVPHDRRPT